VSEGDFAAWWGSEFERASQRVKAVSHTIALSGYAAVKRRNTRLHTATWTCDWIGLTVDTPADKSHCYLTTGPIWTNLNSQAHLTPPTGRDLTTQSCFWTKA